MGMTISNGKQQQLPAEWRSRSSPMAGAPGHRRKQIAIVGGGFAGIAAARALRRCDADVLLIDRRNHRIFQPLLYQVATAILAPSEISAPLRQLAKIREMSV
jgi:NADH dehydrogenase